MEEITITVQESGIGVPSGGTTGQALVKKTNSSFDTEWADVEGVGGAVTSVNGAVGVVVLDADDIDDTSTTNKFVTSSDITKLSNLSGTNTGDQDLSGYLTSATAASTYEPLKGADDNYVTDAEKVVIGNTSGTNTGDQDLSTLALKTNVLELDNTDAFTPVGDYHPATKKYVDDAIVGGGSYTDEQAQDAVGNILVDSSEIDFTYSDATPSITASLVAGSIDETKLDASVNASLDLADSALQSADIADFETTTELNTRDTNNRARANHTGTQAISTVTGLQTALDNKLDDSQLIDDDTFATATSTNIPSAESVKAYVDANAGGGAVTNDAYVDWEANTTEAPSADALFNKIESVIAGVGTGATPISHTFTGGESSYNFGTTITDSHQIAYGTTTSDLVLLQEGVSYSKSGSTVTFIGFTALADDVIIYYPNVAVPTTYDASETTVDASGFSGNLSGTDTDVQTALETIDALSLGGGSGTVTSVAVSGSDGIEVDSGSPITTSGTIALGLNKTNTLTFLNVEDGAEVNDTGAEIVSKIDTELGSTDWQGGGSSSTTLEATLTITNPTISGGVSTHEIVPAQGVGKIIMIESFNAFSVGGSAATGNTSITGRYGGLGGNSLANNVIMSAAGGSYTINGGGTTTGTTGDLTNRAFNIVVNNTTDQSLTVTIFVKIRYVIGDTTTGF